MSFLRLAYFSFVHLYKTDVVQSGQSSLNYFMDNLLQAAPRDSFPLEDAYFEVDVQNDTVLEFYPFEISNGTVRRFRRRVQRQGDCYKVQSAGSNVITCPLSFAGLTATYVLHPGTPGVDSRDLQFFVHEGHGAIEITASPGRRTQLTEFRLSSVNVTMQKMSSVLIHPDVDDIFATKAAEAVERTLWAALSGSYADMMKVVVGSLRTQPVIT
ncbi:uncharacterized protein LOC119400998 [Rhipicephalus sanguineus]|uniref:uncharacterized protein LOC119400998 n=1 Tax=Rhipicephalus sanguineus TaxID=34632 RepID=UPI0020C26A73|nr:uncharacterized protein LOC119400998 [Rhipicephalus sanguineus]